LYKKCAITTLLNDDEPTKILSEYNSILFEPVNPDDDAEEIALYAQHPGTTDEIKECLKDLKVLNPKDFKLILKWHKKMRKFGSLETEKTAPESIELTEEQKYNLLQQEIDDRIKKEARRRKKKMKERLKKIQNMRLKIGVGNIEDEFEAPTDAGLFHLTSIRKQLALENLNDSNMDKALKILKKAKKDEEVPVIESDSEYSDPEVELDIKNERYLDLMYERYIKDNENYRKKN